MAISSSPILSERARDKFSESGSPESHRGSKELPSPCKGQDERRLRVVLSLSADTPPTPNCRHHHREMTDSVEKSIKLKNTELERVQRAASKLEPKFDSCTSVFPEHRQERPPEHRGERGLLHHQTWPQRHPKTRRSLE